MEILEGNGGDKRITPSICLLIEIIGPCAAGIELEQPQHRKATDDPGSNHRDKEKR